MAKKNQRSESEIREAIANSYSMASTLRALGLCCYGGGMYRYLNQKIRVYNIDISHFTGQAHLKGKTHGWSPKIPTEDILIENSSYGAGSSTLKKRLFKEGLLRDECYICGITHWCGKKLSLQLDHINGVSNDNRLTNLRILCPNCHSLSLIPTAANLSDTTPRVKTERRQKSAKYVNQSRSFVKIARSGLVFLRSDVSPAQENRNQRGSIGPHQKTYERWLTSRLFWRLPSISAFQITLSERG